MKYVMLEDEMKGKHPVLFHEKLVHSVVAHGICREYRSQTPTEFWTVVNAGFYDPEYKSVYGRSESLNMKIGAADAERIHLGPAVAYSTDAEVLFLCLRLEGEVNGIR
jgi:hypothetical protein